MLASGFLPQIRGDDSPHHTGLPGALRLRNVPRMSVFKNTWCERLTMHVPGFAELLFKALCLSGIFHNEIKLSCYTACSQEHTIQP